MLFAVLAIQPFLWDGPLGPHDAPPRTGWLFAILDTGVEYVGGAMILAALACCVADRASATGGSTPAAASPG